MVHLKEVRLFYSKYLKELPDFSKATNLEVLNLTDCSALNSVHPSIFSLDKLEILSLYSCYSLKKITRDILLKSLRHLKLAYCLNHRELWDIRFNALPSYQSKLEVLILRGTLFKIIPELPSSLEVLLVEGCESLRTVLFPSMVVEQFKQNRKRVEFWNCMNLDVRSLKNIALNAQISMKKYAYQHILGRKDKYDSSPGEYWYPGNSIPEWLEYKTTKDDMTIDILITQLSPPLGFVFCFILSKGNVNCDRIELNVTTIDGESESEGDGEQNNVNIYMIKSFFSMDTDHVFVVYRPQCSSYLSSIAKTQTRFKIKATAKSDLNEAGPLMELKGFGVSIINQSTYLNFIQQMELFDYINKWNRILLSIIFWISFQRLRMRNLI